MMPPRSVGLFVLLSGAWCVLSPAGARAADEAKVRSVTVAPAAVTVFVGQTQRFAAEIAYETEPAAKVKPVWSVTGEIGVISVEGVLTAGPKRASGTVVATAGGKSASARVSVVPYAYGACHVDGRIVYSVSDPGGDSHVDLFAMAADGSNPTNLTANAKDPPDVYDVMLDQGHSGCWSPDGTRIVYQAEGNYGVAAIMMMDPDGGNRRVVARSAETTYCRPTFSPDGTRILLDARPTTEAHETGPGDIFTMNADGSSMARLTTDPAAEEDACWSPDGKRIAFVRERDVTDGTVCEIWVMDADGRNARRLTPQGAVEYRTPAWSPDGARIACTMRGGDYGANHEIGLVSVADGSIANLTQSPDIDEYGPAWSWDGARILFATTDAPGLVCEIWSANAEPGATPTNLTNRPDDGNYIRLFAYDN
jgi:Tol biopolymer transport system component